MSDIADKSKSSTEDRRAYWRANLRLLGTLMAIWFAVSFGAGILFRPFLDQFMLGGFPLGFWFAQQGSIYVFIVLIAIYAWRMHRIERDFALDDDDADTPVEGE
ncbi:DUF4212 domain-containing protein [Qipengyuania sp. G39]|uniref:DUF4212 domain-containing protein n=1 Tax=Qipengyuania profundimaris TaxID=3067652 RepID=A0ABT9HSC2_9SPHN|nr:DUF4212 domain-containing protein [Qipengyuania sp. G39]MDP4576055.1 DUF4212 domain-containing protein [Qipengyuania sp. G39]